MYPEYLINSDTQDMIRRVSEMAASDEPELRAHCQEVSYQTDTSSLCLQEDCVSRVNDAVAVLSIIANELRKLTQLLSNNADIFRTQKGQAEFPVVCRAITRIEEERLHLLECITVQTQMRRTIASSVADANSALHFLSVAGRAVSTDVRACYDEPIERIKTAYERLTKLDASVKELQSFYMTMVECHLSVFMERLRIAADFNHAGEALDRAAIYALCRELLILLARTPNVSF